MTPEQIERVFGRERLKMATGEHVEVFRESVGPGERCRYTKRFLATSDADFGQWTEREWRILARLIGHGIRCVPDVVQFDGGAMGGIRLVQTYDAGITVDQWATLLPVSRDGAVYRHVFEDCAHWWALAHHCLAALDEIHPLHVVHLDIKGDNICVPYGPAGFDPDGSGLRLYPIFTKLALIDFAFSLVSRENLATALPIGWQKDYDYQSPRLLKALDAGRKGDLQPTKDLDWRCDLYSLAAMLKRYLPTADPGGQTGWTPERYDDARTLIFRLRECHDRDLPHWRPHQQLMDFTATRIGESDLAASLERGWELARDVASGGAALPITPMTRTARSVRAPAPLSVITPIVVPTAVTVVRGPARARVPPPPPPRKPWRPMLVPAIVTLAALATPSYVGNPEHPLADRAGETAAAMRSLFEPAPSEPAVAASAAPTTTPAPQAAEPPQPASTDQTSTRVEKPAAAIASNDVRAEPDTRAPSRTTKGHAKPPTPPTRTPRLQNSAQSASTIARPTHPLPRVASIASPKPSHNASIASAGTSGHSSSRQSQSPPPRFPVPTPAEIAAATVTAPVADSTSPRAPMAAESPAVALVDPGREHGQSGYTTSQAAAAATEDRGAAVTGTPPHPQSDLQRPAPARPDQAQRSVQNPQRVHDWRALFASLGKLLRGREEPPAPVEERRAQLGAPPAGTLRAPPQSAPSLNAQVKPAPSERSEVASIPVPTEELRAQAGAGAVRLPAVSAPLAGEPRIVAFDGSQDEYTMQARRVLADTVPRIAAQSQPDVAKVLWTAANANQPSQRQMVINATSTTWSSESTTIPAANVAPAQARRLYGDSRRAFESGNVVAAFNLQLKAFGANPRDPDIAAYLAFLHLKMIPAQPETARQLAMHAIVVSGSQRTARPGDWNTLAVASALTGRNIDASRALLVEIALTRDLDWSCQAALESYASFGERLRSPVQMMLARVRSQGYESPYCAWPPYRSAAAG